MNMIKPAKTIISTVAVCIVIAFASVASVNASGIACDVQREHQGNKHKIKHLAKVLLLSEQQQVRIKVIKKQAKEQHKVLRESMKQFKIEEKKLLQTKLFDEKAYSALHATYQPIFEQIALVRVKTKHAIFHVLTAEQQVKWLKTIEHHKGHGKKMRG